MERHRQRYLEDANSWPRPFVADHLGQPPFPGDLRRGQPQGFGNAARSSAALHRPQGWQDSLAEEGRYRQADAHPRRKQPCQRHTRDRWQIGLRDLLRRPKVIVAAYDFDGNEVWRKSPGDFQSAHGFGIPPILYKDLVIINCDQDAEKHTKPAYIVALNKATGEEKWRIDRPNRIRSYTPPFIAEAGGKMQMVLTGCKTVASYDPDTGKPIWNIEGPTEQFVASMILHKGHFYLTAGFPTFHVMCIKPDGTGDITNTHVVWHENKGAGYVPSPIAHGNNIFLVKDDGFASCRDDMTGKLHWLERLGKHFHSSPVEADGHLYFTEDAGITHVLKAGTTFEEIAKNPLGEDCFSSPAFSRGQIFIRGAKNLFCIGKEKLD